MDTVAATQQRLAKQAEQVSQMQERLALAERVFPEKALGSILNKIGDLALTIPIIEEQIEDQQPFPTDYPMPWATVEALPRFPNAPAAVMGMFSSERPFIAVAYMVQNLIRPDALKVSRVEVFFQRYSDKPSNWVSSHGQAPSIYGVGGMSEKNFEAIQILLRGESYETQDGRYRFSPYQDSAIDSDQE